jgi:TolB-like protein
LERKKKIFILILLLCGGGIAYFNLSDSTSVGQSKIHQNNSPLPQEAFPSIGIFPIHTTQPELRILGKGILEFWKVALQLSPSLVFIDSKTNLVQEQDPRIQFRKFARQQSVDFIYSGLLSSQDGKVYLTPVLYQQSEDTILKARSIELEDEIIAESIYQSLDELILLTELVLKRTGREYRFDPGQIRQEDYMPSSDTVQKYFRLLSRVSSENPPILSEWEDLTKLEPLFWNPWEKIIALRYAGKEESYETRYFIESFAKKNSSYFHFFLGKFALEYGRNLLAKKNKYLSIPYLELANNLFLSSGKPLTMEYAVLLNSYAEYYLLDKDLIRAKLSLLNSQEILHRLEQEKSLLYMENKLLLSSLFKLDGQLQLAILELEDALLISHTEWVNYPDDYQFLLAQAYYNLGTLNLDIGRTQEAKKRLQSSISLLQDSFLANTDITFFAKVNLAKAAWKEKDINTFLQLSLQLDNDIRILGLEQSEIDSKNSYNLSLAYLIKSGIETSAFYKDRYSRMTSYSKLRSIALDSEPESFPLLEKYQLEPNAILSDYESSLLKSFTGKYRIESQSQDIRSRTYTDRLEDHEIFLSQLFKQSPARSKEMARLQELLHIKGEYKTGKDVVFVDIGPALGNLTQPAVTSISLVEKFPDISLILQDLPGEVEFFFKETEPTAREKVLAIPNVHILSGDGVLPLKDYLRKESAWKIPARPIPKLTNKLIVIRTANSIDIYEPYTKVLPYLESIVKDFSNEDVLLFFNRVILIKTADAKRFEIIGSQSLRGFYHNTQSLDRQGDPAFLLSSIALTRGEN